MAERLIQWLAGLLGYEMEVNDPDEAGSGRGPWRFTLKLMVALPEGYAETESVVWINGAGKKVAVLFNESVGPGDTLVLGLSPKVGEE